MPRVPLRYIEVKTSNSAALTSLTSNETPNETSYTIKTQQLTKKDNHRPNWPNRFLILGAGIVALIILIK